MSYSFSELTTENPKSEGLVTLFEDTFAASEGPDEGRIIGALVHKLLSLEKSALSIFVATKDNTTTGAIFFTSLSYQSGQNVKLLSPVAIAPAYQGQGLGSQLIKFGLTTLTQRGVDIAVTYGDPNFYSRCGFQSITTQELAAPYPLSFPQGWLAISLSGAPIAGRAPVTCAQPFQNSELW